MNLSCVIAVALLAATALPALAAPESYTVDPMHTYPSLEFSHMGMSVWRGKFNKSSGRIVLDRAAKTGTVDVTIDVGSINFGLAAMDEKARSDDFFNVGKYPVAMYKGTIILMGVTKPVNLVINIFNCMPHPMLKREFCGADAEAEMNWGEYGMKMSQYGQPFIALNGGPHFSFTPAVSFFVNCETQAEVDDFWEKLSAGGRVNQCGWLQDKYGLSWQIVPSVLGKYLQDKDAKKSANVMKAMLQMVKLDIAGLEQAYAQN